MTGAPIRRVVTALLLSLLIAPWCHAAQPAPLKREGPSTIRLLDLFANLWAKHGCIIDPFGRCLKANSTKQGCAIDPYGRCLTEGTSSSESELGCAIDPFGRPVPGCPGN